LRRAVLFVVLLLVLAVLIVYLVKLKGEESPAPAVTVSSGAATAAPAAETTAAPQPTEAPAAPSPTPQTLPSATAAPADGAATPSPTPDWSEWGEKGELTVRLSGEDLSVPGYEREFGLNAEPYLGFRLLVPVEMMQPRYDSNAWYFDLSPQGEGDAAAPAWLELSFVSGTTAEELLPDFMSAYLSFTEIEFSGSSVLGTVNMHETITASGDSLLVKAWLLDVPQGVFTAVLCCSLDRLDPDLSYLEATLETLTVTVEK